MSRRPFLIAVLFAGAFLAACGSDDDTTSGDGDTTGPAVTTTFDPRDCAAGDAGGMGESPVPDPVVPRPTIDGVEVFANLTHNHAEGCVAYAQNPPVGGDHAGTWQSCGFYSESIVVERGVHSMEHGAVWITYHPELPADQLDVLEGLAAEFVLVTPWNRDPLSSPVVASAWGLQLPVPSVDDPRLAEFVAVYANGPQNREPGAPCMGGSNETV
jgi:hypothetical protein